MALGGWRARPCKLHGAWRRSIRISCSGGDKPRPMERTGDGFAHYDSPAVVGHLVVQVDNRSFDRVLPVVWIPLSYETDCWRVSDQIAGEDKRASTHRSRITRLHAAGISRIGATAAAS